VDSFDLSPEVRKQISNYHAAAVVIGVVGVIAGIACFVWSMHLADDGNEGFILPLILGFGIAVGAVALGVYLWQKGTVLFKDHAIRGVIEEQFPGCTYLPKGHINEAAVARTGMFPRWTTIKGSDLTRGEYNGWKFAFSNLKLTYQVGSGKSRRTVTEFEGIWIAYQMDRTIDGSVAVIEKMGSRSRHRKNRVETDNAAFNAKFHVISQTPKTVFYVLTPQFMEDINRLDYYARAHTNLFFGGNAVHLALNIDRQKFTSTTSRSEVLQQIAYIKKMLNLIVADAYLFGREEPASADPFTTA